MHILSLDCIDQPGIVAAVATTLSNDQCNIEESSQFFDPFSGRFFMRVVFRGLQHDSASRFRADFHRNAAAFDMRWTIHDMAMPTPVLILVSKADHCLHDLLYRIRARSLNIDIRGIVSNHADLEPLAKSASLPFHHFSMDEGKENQERRIQEVIQESGTELIVLARYMQVLSSGFSGRFTGRIVNIHHSFLPGFKGARPYHQAFERGVKIIGATAHFVTGDLDEGPIIAQGVEHVDHAQSPEKLQQIGRDIESRVLSRAVRLYAERRVFLHGNRTVIL